MGFASCAAMKMPSTKSLNDSITKLWQDDLNQEEETVLFILKEEFDYGK